MQRSITPNQVLRLAIQYAEVRAVVDRIGGKRDDCSQDRGREFDRLIEAELELLKGVRLLQMQSKRGKNFASGVVMQRR